MAGIYADQNSFIYLDMKRLLFYKNSKSNRELKRALRRLLGTISPPSHCPVSCWSVRFLRWSCDRKVSAPLPGTTKSFSLSAGGNCAAGRDCRIHKELVQNLVSVGDREINIVSGK